MASDSDVVLIGTGLAPLLAASFYLQDGKSVLLLNPDFDFFRENSELPLDLFARTVASTPLSSAVVRNQVDSALQLLRPAFPGALEFWTPDVSQGVSEVGSGYRDSNAPWVRARSRLWISAQSADWEDFYLEGLDAGLRPQWVEGLAAGARFPGKSASKGPVPGEGDARGVMVPRLVDVDVGRYRAGVLDFVREKLGPQRVIMDANSIRLGTDGIRFHAGGVAYSVRASEKIQIFWTPRLTSWIRAEFEDERASLSTEQQRSFMPVAMRLLEEWSILSRDVLDPSVVGVFEGMTVFAEVEGDPRDKKMERSEMLHRLAIFRYGKSLPPQSPGLLNTDWASVDSWTALSRLTRDFMRWDRFRIRSMKPRLLFDWPEVAGEDWTFQHGGTPVQIVSRCDGPLLEIVRSVRRALGITAEREGDHELLDA